MAAVLLAAFIFAALSLAAPRPDDGVQPLLGSPNPLPPLRFTSNGTFQISIFHDLHFGENAWDQWGPQQDINSVMVMDKILDTESPQLVVLNGDLITGENAYRSNATVKIDQLVSPLVRRGLTWASTYGNHDSAYNLSSLGILARERLYSGSRTSQMVFGPNAGVSNYYLPVYGCNSGPYASPQMILWFFDSRGGHYYQQLNASGDLIDQPDWVDVSVVEWFRETSSLLAKTYGQVIPSLAFVHIPTNASFSYQNQTVGVDPNHEPGINDDNPLAQQAEGWCPDGHVDPDGCDYGGQDFPFMKALVSTPGLVAVFSGHDHGNDWCFKWDRKLPGMSIAGNGINLCLGRHSGYGGYGPWTRASRQVYVTQEMLKDSIVDTWMRLETGEIIGSVELNRTYGKDYYPVVANTNTSCPTCNYSIITNMPGTGGG